MAITVSNESPINLTAAIEASGDLEIYYGTTAFSDEEDTLDAKHDTQPVRVKIADFVHSSSTWTVDAEHGTNNWSRGTDHCYFDWYYTSGAVEVEVTATAGTQEKKKKVYIDISPIIELPDNG